MMKQMLTTLLCFCMGISAHAQSVLTLNEALKLAVANNYAIQIAKNESEITRQNNSPGAAGMLPTITGTVNQDNQTQNTEQKFLNGTENKRDGAKSNQLNAGVELGWTIFNGFKMFATRNKLKELQDMGELRMKMQMEQVFARVIKAYTDIVSAKQQLKSNQELVALSEQRLQLARDKFSAGRSPQTEVLKAQVDLNTDKSGMMRQQNILRNHKIILNQLLARNADTDFDVEDSLSTNKVYNFEDLLNKTRSQNFSLQLAKKNELTGQLLLKEAQADRYPVIQLKTGYNYNRQESEAGFLQSASNNGYHYGAGLSINLFNGFDVNRRIQNARLGVQSVSLLYKDSLAKVDAAIRQAYNTYALSQQLVLLEKENVKVAQQNLDITFEQYQVGVITSIDLRVAQQNLLDSKIRLTQALTEFKLNETELLRLSGELLTLNEER